MKLGGRRFMAFCIILPSGSRKSNLGTLWQCWEQKLLCLGLWGCFFKVVLCVQSSLTKSRHGCQGFSSRSCHGDCSCQWDAANYPCLSMSITFSLRQLPPTATRWGSPVQTCSFPPIPTRPTIDIISATKKRPDDFWCIRVPAHCTRRPPHESAWVRKVCNAFGHFLLTIRRLETQKSANFNEFHNPTISCFHSLLDACCVLPFGSRNQSLCSMFITSDHRWHVSQPIIHCHNGPCQFLTRCWSRKSPNIHGWLVHKCFT